MVLLLLLLLLLLLPPAVLANALAIGAVGVAPDGTLNSPRACGGPEMELVVLLVVVLKTPEPPGGLLLGTLDGVKLENRLPLVVLTLPTLCAVLPVVLVLKGKEPPNKLAPLPEEGPADVGAACLWAVLKMLDERLVWFGWA